MEHPIRNKPDHGHRRLAIRLLCAPDEIGEAACDARILLPVHAQSFVGAGGLLLGVEDRLGEVDQLRTRRLDDSQDFIGIEHHLEHVAITQGPALHNTTLCRLRTGAGSPYESQDCV